MREEGDYCGIKSTMHLYDICLGCCVEKYLFEILMKNALKQMHHHYRVAKCLVIFPCTLGKEWERVWGEKEKAGSDEEDAFLIPSLLLPRVWMGPLGKGGGGGESLRSWDEDSPNHSVFLTTFPKNMAIH